MGLYPRDIEVCSSNGSPAPLIWLPYDVSDDDDDDGMMTMLVVVFVVVAVVMRMLMMS